MTHEAGWYPDPAGRHEHRYWDGARWTEHVASEVARITKTWEGLAKTTLP